MLCREIIAVCFQIHTKYINTVCGQNVELLNVKLGFRVLIFLKMQLQNLDLIVHNCLCFLEDFR